VTAKEQLRRRVEDMSETEAIGVLETLDERPRHDAAARLDALLDSAPPDDEPWTAEDEAATAEALAEVERGETIPLEQVRRELLG
jgi:hypothetical protein